MGWLSNRYNKRSSKKLGWTPEWFGASNYDSDLEQKVKQFQEEHDLQVDGKVGMNTFRAISLHREAVLKFDKPGELLVNGVRKKINWPNTKIELINPGCYRKSRRKRKINMAVTHFDVCTSASACKRVLEKRGISTHFIIDNDGAILQLVDTNDTAWHAGKGNKYSVGIDISNAYYLKYGARYKRLGLKERPVIEDSVVHGIKLKPHLGYYPEQIEAYKALLKFLNKEVGIELEYPKNEDGSLCTGVHKPAVRNKFKGVVNHYNLTRNKIDTAGLQLDKIIDSLKS